MASLTKRCRHPKGQWDTCGCHWLVRQERNRRTVYTKAGRTRVEAERTLRRISGAHSETVGEALDRWLELKRLNPDARVGSVKAYEGRAKIVREAFGHQPVVDVTAVEVRGFAQGLMQSGRAPSTCRGVCAVLMGALRHAAARGVIHQLPAPPEGLGIPMPAERRHDVTVKELLDVISRMPGKWGLLAELCLLTGLRIGEALAIRHDDVADGFLHIRRTRNRTGSVNGPKTRRSERFIPLDERSHMILELLDLPIACSYTQARRVLDEAFGPSKKTGVGWHVFRHAHAALLEEDGASLREIAERLGHGHNYTVTLGYTLKSQARRPRPIGDLLRRHGSAPSVGSGPTVLPPDELAARRAARTVRRGDP